MCVSNDKVCIQVTCGECERRNKSADLSNDVYCKWLRIVMPKDGFCNYGLKEVDKYD